MRQGKGPEAKVQRRQDNYFHRTDSLAQSGRLSLSQQTAEALTLAASPGSNPGDAGADPLIAALEKPDAKRAEHSQKLKQGRGADKDRVLPEAG